MTGRGYLVHPRPQFSCNAFIYILIHVFWISIFLKCHHIKDVLSNLSHFYFIHDLHTWSSVEHKMNIFYSSAVFFWYYFLSCDWKKIISVIHLYKYHYPYWLGMIYSWLFLQNHNCLLYQNILVMLKLHIRITNSIYHPFYFFSSNSISWIRPHGSTSFCYITYFHFMFL